MEKMSKTLYNQRLDYLLKGATGKLLKSDGFKKGGRNFSRSLPEGW